MKYGYVYVGVYVAIVTIGAFLIYQLESKQLEQKTVAVPIYEDFKPMTFTTLNVSTAEAENLQKKTCGNPFYSYPTPISERITLSILNQNTKYSELDVT